MSTTIFLADDHDIVREGLRSLLEEEPGFEVVGEAANGRDAVEWATKLSPDVMILDIAMPELNGIEAASRFHGICPDTRIIIVSIYSTHEHIVRALRAGARGYILKESAGAEIVRAIQMVLAGHRFMSPKIADMIIDEYLDPKAKVDTLNPLAKLTSRERQILQMVAEGRSSLEISRALNLSPKSVDTYRSR
jgi:DNA-binding NarL/FixJ family response regulator